MNPAELAELEVLCFPETGFVVGQIAADQAEIITLGVLPDFRNKGHGTELLTSFEKTARLRGATEIFLEVSAENKPAIGLYRTNKFEPVGRRRKYYKDAQGMAIDAFILKKVF